MYNRPDLVLRDFPGARVHFYIVVGHTEHYYQSEGPDAGELYEYTKQTQFLKYREFDFPLGHREKWDGSDAEKYWIEKGKGNNKGKGKGQG